MQKCRLKQSRDDVKRLKYAIGCSKEYVDKANGRTKITKTIYNIAPPRERQRETDRDKVHVLTRSAGRLPQAPTPALGPCQYRGRGQGKERGWIQGGRLESSLVSTGFNWSGRKERGKIAK